VCLPNTPLTKNQRLEKKIKTMFGKHTLRTKYYVFSLIKIEHAKHFLTKRKGSAQLIG
jgi:hypothetical protein